VLSDDELAACLRELRVLEGRGDRYIRDALTTALYLGGQRAEQWLRLEWRDVDLGARALALYDSKGRRAQARVHVLPITPVPLAILKHAARLRPMIGACSRQHTSRH
jgi:integrase